MAQHVTTLTEIHEGMDPNVTPSRSEDLIYCEHGTGSNRARAFTIQEIVDEGMSQSFSNAGDIAFSDVTTSAGMAKKGEIQNGKLVGKMFANIVQLLTKTLRWHNESFGTTELVYNGLRFFDGSSDPDEDLPAYRFDNDGVIKASKVVVVPTAGNQENDKAAQYEYRSMTNCETHAGTGVTPTEYYTAVMPGSGGYQGNDDFTLDSTNHEPGSIVLVTNTGESLSGTNDYPVKCYVAADTQHSNVIKEIPARSSAMFLYRGLVDGHPFWSAIS